MAEPHVLILGGGPAGVGAAYQLRSTGRARVTLLEQQEHLGGNAGSFEWGGQRLDYGSHRLHPACDPDILADIKNLLGDDLRDRPRHGRIRLRGRWIRFPLRPMDLLFRLDPGFAAGVVADALRKPMRRQRQGDATFASVLSHSLGSTISRDFYFPYARKIWGLDPEAISANQARRRVSAGSFGRLVLKVLRSLPGLGRPGEGRFYYPRRGFGQITEAFGEAADQLGAVLQLGWRVVEIHRSMESGSSWRVVCERGSERREHSADVIWSSLPISVLARLTRPAPPPEVLQAAGQIRYRAMLLVYLRVPVPRFTEFDAHYFPGADVSITRLSEPKNYSATTSPNGSTVLCAELPCDRDDEVWAMDDEQLVKKVAEDLRRVGLPLQAPPEDGMVRRLPFAYPIYESGYEVPFGTLDRWADTIPNLLTFGRQGLFAHDNTHHALAMAYAAVDCMRDGHFDRRRWAGYREVFTSHVVED